MRKSASGLVLGLLASSTLGFVQMPSAIAQTVDCTPLLVNYVCAFPVTDGPIARIVSVSGEVLVGANNATTPVAVDTAVMPGDSVLTGDGQAFFDGGASCNFTIGQQTSVTMGVQNSCVVVSVTDVIVPTEIPASLAGTDALTTIAVLGAGGGVLAYVLLQSEEDDPDPVTPP